MCVCVCVSVIYSTCICMYELQCHFFPFVSSFLFEEVGNNDSVFDAERTVGTLIIAKSLDAEQLSFYNLTVQATDGIRTACTQVVQIFISTAFHVPSQKLTLIVGLIMLTLFLCL